MKKEYLKNVLKIVSDAEMQIHVKYALQVNSNFLNFLLFMKE